MSSKGKIKTLIHTYEENEVVLRFVLYEDKNTAKTCELRGIKIYGGIDDNDVIEILSGQKAKRSGIAYPTKLRNHTPNSLVTVKRRGFFSSIISDIFSIIIALVIGAMATLTVLRFRPDNSAEDTVEPVQNNLESSLSELLNYLPIELYQIPLSLLVGSFSAILALILLTHRGK